MKRIMLLVFVLAALMVAGCQALEIGVVTGRSGASIEVTISEEELNAALAESVANADSEVSVVPEISFDNGSITLSATVTDANGTTASGSITFLVTQEDNKLRIYTTNVSLVGTDSAGNQALNLQVAINREVAQQLAGQTGPTFDPVDGAVYVDSIQIVPGEMTITVRLPG
ncbi:MAG: hypothetical protein U0452_10780 [Anaerolineae bacterium]